MRRSLDGLQFSNGLIPTIIQDHQSHEVLMVAYMSRESLERTRKTGETHFWSRSRKKLWRKGETSGHIQKVRAIYADCDQDALLIEVEQRGVACHTGKRSCFFNKLNGGRLKARPLPAIERPRAERPIERPGAERPIEPSMFDTLYETISERKRKPSSKSYTSSLFKGGLDLILKKVGEEAGELVISAKNRSKKAIVHETADLLYHLWVALSYHGIPLEAIEEELRRRSAQSGLAEKRSRKRNR